LNHEKMMYGEHLVQCLAHSRHSGNLSYYHLSFW
jgi:hypothetical protein